MIPIRSAIRWDTSSCESDVGDALSMLPTCWWKMAKTITYIL